MSDEITYSRAEIDDFLDIARLDREAWKESPDSEFIPDGEHVWRLWVEHALVFCAKKEGRVIGAALAFPTMDGRQIVHKAFVDREHRGRGVGTRLFALLMARLDELSAESLLTVNPANSDALALYAKFGFEKHTLVRGYYRPSEDRCVLVRRPRPA
jgi:phosphinothricin acetyltransferase